MRPRRRTEGSPVDRSRRRLLAQKEQARDPAVLLDGIADESRRLQYANPAMAPHDPRALADWLSYLRDALGADKALLVRIVRGEGGRIGWEGVEPLAVRQHFDIIACSTRRRGKPCRGHPCLKELPLALRPAVVDGSMEIHEEELPAGAGIPNLVRYWFPCRVLLAEDAFLLLLLREPSRSVAAYPFSERLPQKIVSTAVALLGDSLNRAALGTSSSLYWRERNVGPSEQLDIAATRLLFDRAWLLFRATPPTQVLLDWPDVELLAPAAGLQSPAGAARLHDSSCPEPYVELELDDVVADMLSARLYLAREATDQDGRLPPRQVSMLWGRLAESLMGVGSRLTMPPKTLGRVTIHLAWPPEDENATEGTGPRRFPGPRISLNVGGERHLRTRLAAAGAFAWLAYAMDNGRWVPAVGQKPAPTVTALQDRSRHLGRLGGG